MEDFECYYPGQNYVDAKNPNVEEENNGWDFNGIIEFQFQTQYSYCKFKSSFINGLVKWTSVLVYFFVIWSILCRVVKNNFMSSLQAHMKSVDNQIRLENQKPVNKRKPDFEERLSFEKIYQNAFQVKRLEALVKEAKDQ